MTDHLSAGQTEKQRKEQNSSAAVGQRGEKFDSDLELFLTGERRLLDDHEFVRGLIKCFNRQSCPEPAVLNAVLEELLPAVLFEKGETRERVLLVLFHASEFFLDNQLLSGTLCCNFILQEWLREESALPAGTEAVMRQFARTIISCTGAGEFTMALDSLELLDAVRSQTDSRPAALRSIVSSTLKAMPDEGLLVNLFRSYPAHSGSRELAEEVLDLYGTATVPSLLAKLAASATRDERAALRDILFAFGDELLPSLLSCLREDPPWAVVCTALSLLGEIGSDPDYRSIEPFFSYPDVRVQKEALNAVSRLNEERRRERFLIALPMVDESLCLDLLAHLLELADFDESFYTVLLRLAARRSTFSFSRAMDLLSLILTGLKAYPREETLSLLNEMRGDYQRGVGGARIVLLIDDAISVVAPKVRHSRRTETDSEELGGDAADDGFEEMISPIEEKISRLMNADDESEVGKYVYDQAQAALSAENYRVAEYLKDRLLEVDPFALSEVVRLGNLIDNQRRRAVTPHQMSVWSRLNDSLTSDEFNSLYTNSRPENYDQGDILVKSGDMDRSLFLINSGSVSLSCHSGGMERFLRRVSPGIILGGEQFFDASVWTVTLKALSPVQVQVVGQTAWRKISEECPGIGEKLRDFCSRCIDISKLITLSGDDRRADSRYILNVRTRHSFVDPVDRLNRRKPRSFKGELLDFSRGGVAFSLKFPSREKGMKMLGRQLLTAVDLGDKYSSDFPGLVVGVRLYDPLGKSYSVHVKFAREIDNEEFLNILQVALPDS